MLEGASHPWLSAFMLVVPVFSQRGTHCLYRGPQLAFLSTFSEGWQTLRFCQKALGRLLTLRFVSAPIDSMAFPGP